MYFVIGTACLKSLDRLHTTVAITLSASNCSLRERNTSCHSSIAGRNHVSGYADPSWESDFCVSFDEIGEIPGQSGSAWVVKQGGKKSNVKW